MYMYLYTCKHTNTYNLDQVVSPKETSKGTASGTILLIKKTEVAFNLKMTLGGSSG